MEAPASLPARSTKPGDITETTIRAFENTPNPRIKELLIGAVKHLHAFASEVKLTTNELIQLAEILAAAGKISTLAAMSFS